MKDVFELQDQITDRVVGVVEPSLRKFEIERARQKRPESLEAYDLFLRALPYLAVVSPANLPMAAQFLKDALSLEPNYAVANAYLAWCHQIGFTHGGREEADKLVGLRHARMATTAEVDDATALAVGALVIGILAHDTDAAFNAIERAVSVNPSSSAAYYLGAFLYASRGHSVTGTTYAQRALRLSPFDPLAYHAHLALTFAAIQEERYDDAAAHGAKLAQVSPNLGGHVITYAVYLRWRAGWTGRCEFARARWRSNRHLASAQVSQWDLARELLRNSNADFERWACPSDPWSQRFDRNRYLRDRKRGTGAGAMLVACRLAGLSALGAHDAGVKGRAQCGAAWPGRSPRSNGSENQKIGTQ